MRLPLGKTVRERAPAHKETPTLAEQTAAGRPPGADDECALYDEYVRGFDDVPTLTDPVVLPPPRVVPPEFRLGERKNIRRHAREDANVLRETSAREQAELYAEYSEPVTAKAKSGKRRKKRQRRKK